MALGCWTSAVIAVELGHRNLLIAFLEQYLSDVFPESLGVAPFPSQSSPKPRGCPVNFILLSSFSAGVNKACFPAEIQVRRFSPDLNYLPVGLFSISMYCCAEYPCQGGSEQPAGHLSLRLPIPLFIEPDLLYRLRTTIPLLYLWPKSQLDLDEMESTLKWLPKLAWSVETNRAAVLSGLRGRAAIALYPTINTWSTS